MASIYFNWLDQANIPYFMWLPTYLLCNFFKIICIQQFPTFSFTKNFSKFHCFPWDCRIFWPHSLKVAQSSLLVPQISQQMWAFSFLPSPHVSIVRVSDWISELKLRTLRWHWIAPSLCQRLALGLTPAISAPWPQTVPALGIGPHPAPWPQTGPRGLSASISARVDSPPFGAPPGPRRSCNIQSAKFIAPLYVAPTPCKLHWTGNGLPGQL